MSDSTQPPGGTKVPADTPAAVATKKSTGATSSSESAPPVRSAVRADAPQLPSAARRARPSLRALFRPKFVTVAGAAILLGSWTVEHYWTARWSELRHQFDSARESIIQIEIHEGVSTAMLQYTANLEPFNRRLLTTGDLSYLLQMFEGNAASIEAPHNATGIRAPIPDADELRQVIADTLLAEFPSQASSILEGTSNERLTLDQIAVAGELADLLNRWIKAQQMFQAVQQLYDTSISRLRRSEQSAMGVTGGAAFARRYESLRKTIASSRDQFFASGVLLEPGSGFVDQVNSLRLEFGSFLRDRSAELVTEESRYKRWHRAMYVVGSLLLLIGMLLPKGLAATSE
jgi:hypothetical protein